MDVLLLDHGVGPPGERPRAVATSVTFETITPEKEGMPWEPTFRLRRNEAQQLMDALWTCGVRPTEGQGSAGQLAAVQAHLKDARTVAFNLLNKVLGGLDTNEPEV